VENNSVGLRLTRNQEFKFAAIRKGEKSLIHALIQPIIHREIPIGFDSLFTGTIG
jgi:hypothetical protein